MKFRFPMDQWTRNFVDVLVWNVFNSCTVDLVFRWKFDAEFALFTESLMPTAEVCLRKKIELVLRTILPAGFQFHPISRFLSLFTYFLYSLKHPPPSPSYFAGRPSCVEDTCEPSLPVFLACMQLCFFGCTLYVRYASIYIVTCHIFLNIPRSRLCVQGMFRFQDFHYRMLGWAQRVWLPSNDFFASLLMQVQHSQEDAGPPLFWSWWTISTTWHQSKSSPGYPSEGLQWEAGELEGNVWSWQLLCRGTGFLAMILWDLGNLRNDRKCMEMSGISGPPCNSRKTFCFLQLDRQSGIFEVGVWSQGENWSIYAARWGFGNAWLRGAAR